MRKCIAGVGFLALASLASTGFAALSGVTNYGAPGAAWPVSSTYGTNPAITSIAVPTDATITAQTVGANVATSHTFVVTSPITIGSVAIIGSGDSHTAADMSIHLYKLNSSAPIGVGGYVPATATEDINGAGNTDDDWLGGGNGLTFQFNGSNTAVMEFVLSGADQVTLPAGNYTFEVWNTAAQNFFWHRSGNAGSIRVYQAGADPNTVVQGSTISRNNTHGEGRLGSLAIYPVPEPGSLALIGFAAAGVLGRRRRA